MTWPWWQMPDARCQNGPNFHKHTLFLQLHWDSSHAMDDIILHNSASIQHLSIQLNLSTSSLIFDFFESLHPLCCLQCILDLINGTIIFYSLGIDNNTMCAEERPWRTFFNDPAVAFNVIELDVIKFVTFECDDSLLSPIHLFSHTFQSQHNPLGNSTSLYVWMFISFIFGWVDKLYQNVYNGINPHCQPPVWHYFLFFRVNNIFLQLLFNIKSELLVHKLQ